MACFLVSVAEAAVVRVMESAQLKKEVKLAESNDVSEVTETNVKIPLSRKLSWLRKLLLGGSALLLFEHVWHGEVVPWFPFLTAMNDPADMAEMFQEMATVGVTMAVLVTLVWLVMCRVADKIVSGDSKDAKEV